KRRSALPRCSACRSVRCSSGRPSRPRADGQPHDYPETAQPHPAKEDAMRAAVYRKYGSPDVVSIEDVPKPVPAERDLLVRMAASSVTSGDARMRAFNLPKPFALPGRLALGIFGPRKKVLGV